MAIKRIDTDVLFALDTVVCRKIAFWWTDVIPKAYRSKNLALYGIGHIHGIKIGEGSKYLICLFRVIPQVIANCSEDPMGPCDTSG